jgi:hypothetical protein
MNIQLLDQLIEYYEKRPAKDPYWTWSRANCVGGVLADLANKREVDLQPLIMKELGVNQHTAEYLFWTGAVDTHSLDVYTALSPEAKKAHILSMLKRLRTYGEL